MSEKNQDAIEGIVRFSLTESVLNNKNMTKTAADQFGQQYLLYGPTEKRVCPKLRGKNLSVGDVVSEYTCRHHCEAGIVIDDNKTICGEALWRAHGMDKFSREYVDEDGNIVGGYINKRFEVNRNVPEENKMRLKPGETRKPRPAAWGNMESRLQDMRSKEGQTRDYRPETNTGDPFEWCHDSDQNNVEVSQTERDKREEAMGNKLVQYTNRDQGENNSKKAFNLKQFKTAQAPVAYSPQDTHQIALNPTSTRAIEVGVGQPANVSTDQKTDLGKPMEQKPMSLDDMETDKFDFAGGQEKVQSMSNEQLMATMKDLNKVIEVQEASSQAGASTPKLGYYHDERHTVAGEIMRRRKGTTAGFNLKQHKTAENPQPHTVALPDHDTWRQQQPEDVHTPDVKPSKKKT